MDGNREAIYFSENTSPGTTGDPSDTAETTLPGFPVTLDYSVGPNVRVTAADTSFNGDVDYFLDVAVSESDLVGVLGTGSVRFLAGSSSSPYSLSIDVARCDNSGTCTLSTGASDPAFLDGTAE